MEAAAIKQHADLQIDKADLADTKRRIAALDAEIAKLVERRDRHLKHQGFIEGKIKAVRSAQLEELRDNKPQAAVKDSA